jgi:predicted Zn-dependent protease
MAPRAHICLLCGHTFESETTPERCPQCLRTSGLQAAGDAVTGSGGVRRSLVPFVSAAVALLAIAGAVVGYFAFVAEDGGREVGLVSEPSEAAAGEVATALAPDPAEVTAAVESLTSTHLGGVKSASGEERIEALTGFLAARGLRLHDAEQPWGRAPLLADDIAKALASEEKVLPPLLSLEAAAFATALATAIGLDAEVVEDEGARNRGTSLLRKRFLTRVRAAANRPAVTVDPFGQRVGGEGVAPRGARARRAYHQGLVALAAAESEDFRAANEAISRGLTLLPDDPALLFLKGQIAVLRGMVQFGIEDMERAVARQEDALGHYNLGVAYLQAQRFFKAHQALRRALELDPRFVGGWLALANLHLARLPLSPEEEREGLIQSADEAVRQARDIDPEADGIAPLMAQVMLAQGDERGAFSLLDEAIRAYPERPAPYLLLGTMLANQRKWPELVAYVRQGYRANPGNPQIRQLLVMGYLAQGRPEDAQQVLTEALALDPSLPDVRVELAGLLLESGDPTGAERLLGEELAARPESVTAALLLAQLDMEAGRFAEATTRLDAVLERRPAHFDALVLRYIVALEQGQESAAERLLRRIATAQPNGRSFLAQMLLEQGMFAQGVAVLQSILRDQPGSVADAVMLVAAHTMAGQEREAEQVRTDLLAHAGPHADELSMQLDAVQAEARRMRAQAEQHPGHTQEHDPGCPGHHPPGHDCGAAHEPESPSDGGDSAPIPPGIGGAPSFPMPELRMPRAPGEEPDGATGGIEIPPLIPDLR